MDNFKKLTQMNMTEEENQKLIKENKKHCICPDCPTYNECAQEKNELLYCILDKSQVCITKESGCICPACLITEILDLTNDYFCIKGTEKLQGG